MNPRCPFQQQLSAAWPAAAWRDITVLIAVSGGSDSVALLRGMASMRQAGPGRLVVGHFNHQLRGDESSQDEAFVRQLCQKLGVPCETGRAATRGSCQVAGIEARAREDRYQFLGDLADHLGARYLATAHTADDQAETVLHRIMRGTGLAGLAGIPVTRRVSCLTTIIRPILTIRRQITQAYLRRIGQPFRHDSSNDQVSFTRNRIRHQLMPQLAEQYNPKVTDALLRLGQLAGQAQSIMDQLVEPLVDESVMICDRETVTIRCERLWHSPALLVQELFIWVWKKQHWPLGDMGIDQWEQLAQLVCESTQETIAPMLPGGVRVRRIGKMLDLRRS